MRTFFLVKLIIFILCFHLQLFAQYGPQNVIAPTLCQPNYGVAEDLDQDGDVDLVVSTFTGGVLVWFENTGGGEFTEQKLIDKNIFVSTRLFLEDLDEDGDIDIITISEHDDQIIWYENNGQSEFLTSYSFEHGNQNFQDFWLEDIDNDGDKDVLLLSTSYFVLFENVGQGQFEFALEKSVAAAFSSNLTAYDYNDDGLKDVVVTGNGLFLFENSIDGFINSEPQLITLATHHHENIQSADMDQDGDLDLIYTTYYGQSVRWMEKEGLNYTEHLISIDQAFSLSQGVSDKITPYDVDQDGFLEILVSNVNGYTNYLNLPPIEPVDLFDSSNRIFTIGDSRHSVIADFDGDSFNEIAFLDDERSGQIVITTADITFEIESSISNRFADAYRVVSLDVDNDNYKDVAYISLLEGDIAWSKNLTNGTFSEKILIGQEESFPKEIVSSDITGNNFNDLIVAYSSPQALKLYENSGNELFLSSTIITENVNNIKKMTLADIDNDLDVDIIVLDDDAAVCSWYENISGDMTSVVKHNVGTSENSAIDLVLGDIDNDGDLDITYSKDLPNGSSIQYMENLGQGMFSPSETVIEITNRITSMNIGDMDQDGDVDLVCGNEGGNSGIFGIVLNSLGSLESGFSVPLTIVEGMSDVELGDADNDGDLDILAGGGNNIIGSEIRYIENLGNLDFTQGIILNQYALSCRDVEFADFDNDGDLDAISASRVDGKVAWYEYDEIYVNPLNNIKQYKDLQPVEIIYNSSLKQISIESHEFSHINLTVYDAVGKTIISENNLLIQPSVKIELGALNVGNYLVVLHTADKIILSEKIVVY